MSVAEAIRDEDTERVQQWAAEAVAAARNEDAPSFNDLMDGITAGGPSEQVVALSDRGKITREQRDWALDIIADVQQGGS